jgi:hypothetical protein
VALLRGQCEEALPLRAYLGEGFVGCKDAAHRGIALEEGEKIKVLVLHGGVHRQRLAEGLREDRKGKGEACCRQEQTRQEAKW